MDAPGRLGVAREELALYEGVRLGSGRAFRRLAAAHAGVMGRMAALYGDEGVLVRWTWDTALHGLGMFTWHTSLRAWVVGILVAHGRAVHAPSPAFDDDSAPAEPGADRRGPTPADTGPRGGVRDGGRPGLDQGWAGLAWSPRWSDGGWAAVEDALAGLPLAERELLQLHDVEGWPAREAYDALGLTEEDGLRLLGRGREGVRVAVRRWRGLAPAPDPDGSQVRGVVELLGLLVGDDTAPPPDPELQAVFRAWRSGLRISLVRRLRGALLARRPAATARRAGP